MPAIVTPTHLQSLNLEEFPKNLEEAMAFRRSIPESIVDDYLEIALTDSDSSRELCWDVDLFRWAYSRIDERWYLTEALNISDSETGLPALFDEFVDVAKAMFERGVRVMHLYDSGMFSTIAYGFELPFDDSNLLVAHVPEAILGACEKEVLRIGYFLMTETEM